MSRLKKNNNFIPYGHQDITEDDIKHVIEVLKSDYLTQGPQIELFENSLKEYTKAKYCTALSNATAALHLSCRALGVNKDDIVWTSPISFVASANCALYCGAKIDFVDINADTFNMCPQKLIVKLKKANKSGKLPKVIIPVHMAGQSCQMEQIYQIASEYGVKIIEDASHAMGGKYKGSPVGNCLYSDITVFSFHPVKIITTGEGGATLTNYKDIDKKIKILRSHGIIKNKNDLKEQRYGPWYYEQNELGYNYRISDIHCALGVSQLRKLDNYIQKRHRIAESYNKYLSDTEVEIPTLDNNVYSSFHLYIIQLKEKDRNIHFKIFNFLRSCNIGVNLHYFPIHLQPYYRKMGFKEGMFPDAEAYWQRSISLPIFPSLKNREQIFIIERLKESFTI